MTTVNGFFLCIFRQDITTMILHMAGEFMQGGQGHTCIMMPIINSTTRMIMVILVVIRVIEMVIMVRGMVIIMERNQETETVMVTGLMAAINI